MASGNQITNLYEKVDTAVFRFLAKNVLVGRKARIRLFDKLKLFYENDIGPRDAVREMWGHVTEDGKKRKKALAVCLEDWYPRLRDGYPLSEAVGEWVPHSERILLDAGERGNRMTNAFAGVIKMNETMRKITRKLIGAAIMPLLIFAAMVGYFLFFGTTIVPDFAEKIPPSQWTGASRALYIFSVIASDYLIFLVGGVGALVVLIGWAMPNWCGKWRVYADKIPPFSMYRIYVGAGFMMGLSTMMAGGEELPRILRRLKEGAKPYLEERLKHALRRVYDGQNVGDALYQSGYNFPDEETVMDMRTFAQLEGFGDILHRYADRWLDESIEKAERLQFLVQYGGIAIVAAMLIVTILGVFGLQDMITQSAQTGGGAI